MASPTHAVAPPRCPACERDPGSSLACLACGAVLTEPAGADQFARLGLAPSHELDADDLERRYLRLSRLLHPDHQGAGDEAARARALTNSARLNEAYTLLSDPGRRTEYLVDRLDPEALERTKTLDPLFLMESMELSEAAEQARDAGDTDALARLMDGVRAEVADRRQQLADGLAADTPDTDRLAVLLHELKVFARILRDSNQDKS